MIARLDGGRISTWQAVLLMVIQVAGTSFLVIPAATMKYAGADAWLASLAATLAGLGAGWIAAALARRLPGLSLVEYPVALLGRLPGQAVAWLYVAWFLLSDSTVIRQGAELVTAHFLPETPVAVLLASFVLLAGLAVHGGIEVMARANAPVTLLLLLSIFLLMVFSVREADLQRLLPVLEGGWRPVLRGAVPPAGWLAQDVMLGMLVPCLRRPGDAGKVNTIASLLTGTALTLIAAWTVAAFGPALPRLFVFPVLLFTHIISIADILERLDAVVLAVWVMGVALKAAIWYWSACTGMACLLGLREYRPLVIPVGLLLVALASLSAGNVVELSDYLGRVWSQVSLPVFEVGIPLLLLALAALRGGRPRAGAGRRPPAREAGRW